MTDLKRLLIIDSNALLHRSFHALPPLTTKEGKQTGAVYGYLLTLFKAIKDLKPEYVVACFDTAAPTFRHKKFKDYKAQRPETPKEIVEQIPETKEVLNMFEIPVFAQEGFEADDLIATIATRTAKDLEVYIVTGDLDNLQLVSKNIRVYTLGRGIKDIIIYDQEKVLSRFGVRPDQMIDFKSLVGDPSDNIPGVVGIGDKTAASLLQKFESLENIYEVLEKDETDIRPAVKQSLIKYKEQAFLARELVEMKKDVKINLELKDCAFGNFNRRAVEKILSKLEFNSLINRLPELIGEKIAKQKLLL